MTGQHRATFADPNHGMTIICEVDCEPWPCSNVETCPKCGNSTDECREVKATTPGRYSCGDCGRFLPACTINGWVDYESSIWFGTGTCSKCGQGVDVA